MTPNKGGRPRIGTQVSMIFPPDMLAKIDADAERQGISRAEWVRRACAGVLDQPPGMANSRGS